MYERACTKELLDKAVAGIGRGDVATLHQANSAAFAANDSEATLALAAR